jgi:hypothetical protein
MKLSFAEVSDLTDCGSPATSLKGVHLGEVVGMAGRSYGVRVSVMFPRQVQSKWSPLWVK